jgi:hypothetical protein
VADLHGESAAGAVAVGLFVGGQLAHGGGVAGGGEVDELLGAGEFHDRSHAGCGVAEHGREVELPADLFHESLVVEPDDVSRLHRIVFKGTAALRKGRLLCRTSMSPSRRHGALPPQTIARARRNNSDKKAP